jgi:prolyl-tRNA synthetase
MRWTRTFIPTLREPPSDAESPSHKLMVRAGLIRQLSAGSYSYLPLGYRALRKAEAIVRQEMDRAGAVELFMPALHPPDLWQETGRLAAFGDTLMKLKDRKGAVSVLGPTHEEVVTHIVRNEIKSYRQLPLTLYQIQGKFRDEPRPRHGIIRTREFLMKDAYSFDADEKGLNRSYQAMYDAYLRIYARAELKFLPVEADTGLMGGDVSHEFMAVSPFGEDSVVTCDSCAYAANKEKAECPPPAAGFSGLETCELLPLQEVETPGMTTIEQVSQFLKVPPRLLVKTLLYRTDQGFLAALVRGDHEANEAKLRRAVQAEVLEMAAPEEILRETGGPLGFSGPVGLKMRVVADFSVLPLANFVTGANKKDTHLLNVNLNRDFQPSKMADLRMAVPGDPCPRCAKGKLVLTHGIEVGHVFKLGTRYSKRMNCVFLDEKGEKGRLHPMVMGCYGIGINRIVAAAVENHHDEAGILWPREIAPYEAEIVTVDDRNLRISEAGHDLLGKLSGAGVEVLWDDRDVRPGVKFADADLIGLPVRVTIGKRTVESGTVDLRARNKKEQKTVPIEKAVEAVKDELASYRLL